MKRIIFVVVCLCAASWAEQPATRHTSGNDLRNYCQAVLDHETGARAGICAGYINAYRELAEMLPDEKLLCVPDGVGNEQFIRVLMKYLDQHPERLHVAAPQLIYDAMSEAFPCPAKKPTP